MLVDEGGERGVAHIKGDGSGRFKVNEICLGWWVLVVKVKPGLGG